MDTVSVTILLEYLYNKFLVTFVLCLMGSFIKETMLLSKKYKKINLRKIMLSGVFSSLIVCVITDYVSMTFAMYSIVCVLFGMWGYRLLLLFLNTNFIKKLVSVILRNVSGPLSKYASDLDESLKDENFTEDGNDNDKSNSDIDTS